MVTEYSTAPLLELLRDHPYKVPSLLFCAEYYQNHRQSYGWSRNSSNSGAIEYSVTSQPASRCQGSSQWNTCRFLVLRHLQDACHPPSWSPFLCRLRLLRHRLARVGLLRHRLAWVLSSRPPTNTTHWPPPTDTHRRRRDTKWHSLVVDGEISSLIIHHSSLIIIIYFNTIILCWMRSKSKLCGLCLFIFLGNISYTIPPKIDHWLWRFCVKNFF